MDIKELEVQLIDMLEAEYNGERLPWFKRKDCVHAVSSLIEKSSVGGRVEAEEFQKEMVRLIRATQFEKPIEEMLIEKIKELIDNFMPPIKSSPPQPTYHLLFEYEQAFLQLLRDYADEIKFATLFHQQLKKEHVSFFLYTLPQVFQKIEQGVKEKEAEVSLSKTFVNSYVRNIQQTGQLVQVSAIERLMEIREESRRHVYVMFCDGI